MLDDDNPPPAAGSAQPTAARPADESLTAPRPSFTRPRLPHVPRLSIAYIMLATAVTAVVLTVLSKMLGTRDPRDMDMLLPVLLMAGLASLIGWIYTATLLLGWHAARRTLWRLEPGEWLVLCLANVATMWIGIMLLNLMIHRWGWFGDIYNYSAFRLLRYAEKILPGEMAAVYLLGAVMQRRRPWWSAVMAGAAAFFLSFYWMLGRNSLSPKTFVSLAWFISTGIVICLAGGIFNDRRQREFRHWVHWSGVATSGIASLALVVMMTLALYFRW